MAPCELCSDATPRRAILRRPKTGQAVCVCYQTIERIFARRVTLALPGVERPPTCSRPPSCRPCFFAVFELEIHRTIVNHQLFKRGERVGIAASGGKGATAKSSRCAEIGADSTVLAHIMTLLNASYGYGLDLCHLSEDEGIEGYRDHSLDVRLILPRQLSDVQTVKRNSEQYSLPLKILSFDELYEGWTMDKVVKETGRKGNCTYCGVFRRQALDRGGTVLEVDHLVTGHNAGPSLSHRERTLTPSDDIAETVLMNGMSVDRSRHLTMQCCAATLPGSSARWPSRRAVRLVASGRRTPSSAASRSSTATRRKS